MAETKINLKLLTDKRAKKVLFAEAGKDFVDFLFNILSIPGATIVKLAGPKDMRGSLGELYKSIESLNNDRMLENVAKDSALSPKTNVAVPLLLLNKTENPPVNAINNTKLYMCSSGKHFGVVTNDPNKNCNNSSRKYCGHRMSTEVTFVAGNSAVKVKTPSNTSNGFVKGDITYMVMDNLEIKPSSTISAISLLGKLKVNDVSCLVEKEVQVGLDEGLAILKASLETQAVLSTVFLEQSTEMLSPVSLEQSTFFLEEKMQIFVETPNVPDSKFFTLEVERSHTIQYVKCKIHVKEGFPSQNQVLVFGEHKLEDSQTLADYNIGKDSTLHLFLNYKDG